MKNKMTLCELSNVLVEQGYPDIFDSQVDVECLDLEKMKGSWADNDGENIIYFNIIKIDEESRHLGTIVELETKIFNKKEKTMKRTKVDYGFTAFTGKTWTDLQVDTYNRIQDRINSFGDNPPERLLNDSHALFVAFSSNKRSER